MDSVLQLGRQLGQVQEQKLPSQELSVNHWTSQPRATRDFFGSLV